MLALAAGVGAIAKGWSAARRHGLARGVGVLRLARAVVARRAGDNDSRADIVRQMDQKTTTRTPVGTPHRSPRATSAGVVAEYGVRHRALNRSEAHRARPYRCLPIP